MRFKPGDILTADQINEYLVEHTEEDIATFNELTHDMLGALESKWQSIQSSIEKIKWITQGGNPENV